MADRKKKTPLSDPKFRRRTKRKLAKQFESSGVTTGATFDESIRAFLGAPTPKRKKRKK